MQESCGDQWPAVCTCLKEVKGLVLNLDSIVAPPSRLKDAKAIGPFAGAIGVLVKAGNLIAAWKLVGMLSPKLRAALLATCSPGHVTTLTASLDADVQAAKDRALGVAARSAPYADAIKLRSLCSDKEFVVLPTLTEDAIKHLDGPTLITVLRLTLEDSLTLNLKPRGDDLDVFLSVAKHRGDPLLATVKCIIAASIAGVQDDAELQQIVEVPPLTPELLDRVPVDLQGEVLRLAVEQAANSDNSAKSLAQLASLYGRIDPRLAMQLKSAITDALTQLPADDEAFATIKKAMTDPMRIGDFHEVKQRLEEVGIDILSREVARKDEKGAERQASVAQEMAVVLLSTEEQFHMELAEKLFSMMDEGLIESRTADGTLRAQMVRALPALFDPKLSYWLDLILKTSHGRALVVQAAADSLKGGESRAMTVAPLLNALLDALGAKGDSTQAKLADALPTLCNASHSLELDFILMTKEGKQLVGEAAKSVLMTVRSGDTIASLFKALAHRVDLWTDSRPEIADLVAMAVALSHLDKGEVLDRLVEITPGWRVLALFSSDARILSSGWIEGFRAVAAHSQLGELETLKRVLSTLPVDDYELGAHAFASKMLSLRDPQTGSLLFPVGCFDVMRIIVSDFSLVKEMGTFVMRLAKGSDERKHWIDAVIHVLVTLDQATAQRAKLALVMVGNVKPEEMSDDARAIFDAADRRPSK